MKNYLKESRVIITGATDGLGLAIASQLTSLCDSIVITGRSQDKLDAKVKELSATNVTGALLDLTDSKSITQFAAEMSDNASRTVLINNAGMWLQGPTEEASSAELHALIQTNLTGHMELTTQLIPMMKKNSGQIVFTNSLAGIDISPDFTSYSATKYGLRGYARCLESELKNDNVKVTSIYPGGMHTPLFNKAGNDYAKEPWMMEVEDVAAVCINTINQPETVLIDEISIRQFPYNVA